MSPAIRGNRVSSTRIPTENPPRLVPPGASPRAPLPDPSVEPREPVPHAAELALHLLVVGRIGKSVR